ncbi:hypothetical protein PISL3812_04618 [Talaromyces islandicus]|uniref:Histone chaperone domain-containing protein n=1 Tax=Talaromyces islandicus TaxID=28573 RepID=A0A0U1LW38_TALIS|nr:hypothetical protein PISL3812_04618 [Talaromyces islandicus]
MSNRYEREAEDRYEAENDFSPVSGNVVDSSYNTKKSERTPVQADSRPYDDPFKPPQSNSDQQLERDEHEAIDKSNILGGSRLRRSKPQTTNRYNEGPDEDDVPSQP